MPKVVTRQRGWELNSQPAGCKSNALATRLPSHKTYLMKMLRMWTLVNCQMIGLFLLVFILCHVITRDISLCVHVVCIYCRCCVLCDGVQRNSPIVCVSRLHCHCRLKSFFASGSCCCVSPHSISLRCGRPSSQSWLVPPRCLVCLCVIALLL